MANLKFYKKATAPTGVAQGAIWFNTTNKTIQVYTGGEDNNGWEIYAGIIGASLVGEVLTLQHADGTSFSVDLSVYATNDDLSALESALDTRIKKNADDIATNKGNIDKNAEDIATNVAAIAANTTAIENEVQARKDADAVLQGEIDAVEEDVTELNTKVEELAAAAKTVVAVKEGEEFLKVVESTDSTDNHKVYTLHTEGVASNADLEAEVARAKAAEEANTSAINTEKGRIDTLVGTDTGKSVRAIANEELAAQLIPESAKESLDTLAEIAAWIQSHPDDAAAMNAAIEANAAAIEVLDGQVGDPAKDGAAATGLYLLVDNAQSAAEAAQDTADAAAEQAGLNKTAIEGLTSDLAGVEGRVTTVEGKVSTLEGKVSTLEGEMDAVQETLASGVVTSVESNTAQLTVEPTKGDVKLSLEVVSSADSVATGASGLVTAGALYDFFSWEEFA